MVFLKALLIFALPLGVTDHEQWLPGIPGVVVEPPREEGGDSRVLLVVEIDQEGRMLVEGRVVDEEAIEGYALRAKRKHVNVRLRITAHRKSPVLTVKKVAKAAGNAGISKVIFSSNTKKKEP